MEFIAPYLRGIRNRKDGRRTASHKLSTLMRLKMPSFPTHKHQTWYIFFFWWDVEFEKAISLLPLNQSHTHKTYSYHHSAAIWSVSLCVSLLLMYFCMWVRVCAGNCKAVVNPCVCVCLYPIVCPFISAEIETVGVWVGRGENKEWLISLYYDVFLRVYCNILQHTRVIIKTILIWWTVLQIKHTGTKT